MITVLMIFHVVVAVLMVIVVLMQSGKGGGLGGALGGGGGANTLFGSSQGGNFFTRLTSGLAATFMITSLALTVLKGHADKRSIFDQKGAAQQTAAPVSPGSTANPAGTNQSSAPATGAETASAPAANPTETSKK